MCDNNDHLSSMEKLTDVIDFVPDDSKSTKLMSCDQVLRTQRQNKFMANKATVFLLPNEFGVSRRNEFLFNKFKRRIATQSVNLQRELKRLRFENPGEAMVGGTKIKHNPQRPKRRVAVKTNVTSIYKPYHDRHGFLVTATNKSIDLCDCLVTECPGCHKPCRKCNSQKCSFQCRINRSAIVEEIEVQGVDIIIKNLNLIRC